MPRSDTRRWSAETAHKELVRAIRLFDKDLDSYETRVDGAIQVPLKQQQFDALVSWDFNTGGATWRSSSGLPCQLVRQINAGDMSGAGSMGWLRPPEIRQLRTEEMNLFRTGRYYTDGDAIAVWDALGDGRIRHRSTITASELSRLMDEADAHHRPATGGVLEAIQRFFATILRRNPCPTRHPAHSRAHPKATSPSSRRSSARASTRSPPAPGYATPRRFCCKGLPGSENRTCASLSA